MTIRLEEKKDWREVENLTREAFWNVYKPGCLEHYVLNRYRSNPDFIPELDYVMEEDGKIIGHVMFSKAEIVLDDGTKFPSWTFGPISIHPDYKRKGYGLKLLQYALDRETLNFTSMPVLIWPASSRYIITLNQGSQMCRISLHRNSFRVIGVGERALTVRLQVTLLPILIPPGLRRMKLRSRLRSRLSSPGNCLSSARVAVCRLHVRRIAVQTQTAALTMITANTVTPMATSCRK